MENIEQSFDMTKAVRYSMSELHPHDYFLNQQSTLEPNDNVGTLMIQFDTDLNHFYVIPIEDDRLTPIFLKWQTLYENNAIRLKQEFNEIFDEISEWLLHTTKIKPKPDGFIQWFINTKVGNVLELHLESVLDETANILHEQWSIRTHFELFKTPKVFEKHLHDYCIYKQQIVSSDFNKDPATSPPPPNTHVQPGFDTYIKEEYRAKLMPYLIGIYTEKKPKEIVPMLYALEILEILMCKVAECDQTNLHHTLTCTFGDVGGRTALNSALPLYHKDAVDSTKKQRIEQHKQRIETFLKA